jgi:large subunit ribosomal protein L18
MQEKRLKRQRIHKKIRAKIFGTKSRPRLCVFKSAKHIYAQLIDDDKSMVLVEASDLKIKNGSKATKAIEVGKLIAEKAAKEKIKNAVFDRSGFVFHGRVKAIADGAREGGLKL